MTKIMYWIISGIVAVVGGAAIIYGPSYFETKPTHTAQTIAKPAPAQTNAPAHSSAQTPKSEPIVDGVPEFDIVRVEPTGEIVIAGRATPNALIVLMRGETQHETASADASGHFAMAPKALPPGTHELRLVATDRSGSKTSKQSVFVSVPDTPKGEAVVALQQAGAPTVNLNPVAPKQGERARVNIFAVDVLTTGLVTASGSAHPGASIRLYLNETFIASAKAGDNGAWSLTIEKGITPGLYRLRADDTGPDGKVISRAEVQFDVPNLQANAQPGTMVASASPSNVVVGAVRTATVVKGDSLWRISAKIYGAGTQYTVIQGANSSQIRDPNLIYPGQVFVVPAKSP